MTSEYGLRGWNKPPWIFKVGSRVQKRRPYDGSERAGEPYGAILEIVRLEDGPIENQCVAFLEDESWEFIWNLWLIE